MWHYDSVPKPGLYLRLGRVAVYEMADLFIKSKNIWWDIWSDA